MTSGTQKFVPQTLLVFIFYEKMCLILVAWLEMLFKSSGI